MSDSEKQWHVEKLKGRSALLEFLEDSHLTPNDVVIVALERDATVVDLVPWYDYEVYFFVTEIHRLSMHAR